MTTDGTTAGAKQALANLVRAETELLDLYQHHMVNRPFGHQDLYLLGIARRTLANGQAFKKCVEDRNGFVAAALLRLQLDTVLRLYAIYWVADPEDFAGRVFGCEQVDRLKAADGQQMKDRYLIDKIKDRNPWVELVYKNTSGLIHFSDRHIHTAHGRRRRSAVPSWPDRPEARIRRVSRTAGGIFPLHGDDRSRGRGLVCQLRHHPQATGAAREGTAPHTVRCRAQAALGLKGMLPLLRVFD